ncbi:carboxypeptidase-like regulatory domain-containing protein [Nocardioides sp. LMS-CY]|uniref:carboxypeptidase-like regulatory domain-containing protein n=1 Tax=Nocardioides sp. (strain LMS-CY) TaxID=2840457 RepID=UPI001C0079A0|nr:carboxypeptidase-like regulatory domain-containing protein [Nocardioides sp. LMS-CY]QWF21306.1 carboxypeptidase-like regulatory domain-containing protein [Nocardioides sp. LMS-CY]
MGPGAEVVVRVATEHRLVTAYPGDTVDVRVDVVNTGELIEGVTAHLIGLPDGQISVEPQLLPLFPDAQGQITLSIGVPSHQPAGMHPLTIAVVSHGSGSPTQHVDIDLSVSARPDVRLATDPQSIRSRRTGRFVVTIENAGNVALDATLTATQEDKRTRARFTPEKVRVEPGTSVPTILAVKGPRMFTGAETDRMVTVGLVAKRAHTIPAMDETETGPELEREAIVRLKQKPMVSRGLLTALILMGIVLMWAAIFLLGLTQVLAGDPMTKTAPASFFPASAESGEGSSGEGDAAGGAGATAAPAGAMPKTGLLPAGVGGEISGTVLAASNQQPAGRITVQAYRQSRDGLKQVSSAASQTDGTYSVAGLFPTGYLLKFSADGYRPVWYPNAPSKSGATKVQVTAQGEAEGYNVVIQGKPASITGEIDPGDALGPVTTTVVARMSGATSDTSPIARTVATGNTYTLPNLPAPATYELSFTAGGYQATKVTTAVAGGEARIQPDVVLNAGTGSISGMVTDGKAPLGNVTVTTTVAGQEVSVITPTTGQVGSFTLDKLPTPGTYMLTFSSPDHGSRAEIVDLEAGQSRSAIDVKLVAGTGSVTGILLGADGKGLGGATVIVGGSVQAGGAVDTSSLPTTTTLTEGAVGTFSISGLAAPGDYTLMFLLDGYASETVPISLSGNGAPPKVTATLGTKLGGIRGTVTGPSGAPYVGATVVATNGAKSWSTTSSSPGGTLSNGGYLFSELEPGTYSVTVTADGIRQQTGLVTVTSGATAVQGFTLRAAN